MRRQNQHLPIPDPHPPKHYVSSSSSSWRFALDQPTVLNFIIITRPLFPLLSFVRSLAPRWKWIKYDGKANFCIENVREEPLSLRCVWIVRKYVFISCSKPFYIKISTEWLTSSRNGCGAREMKRSAYTRSVELTKNGKNAEWTKFQFNFFSMASTLRQINYWMRSLQRLQCIFHGAHMKFDGFCALLFDCKSKWRILRAHPTTTTMVMTMRNQSAT